MTSALFFLLLSLSHLHNLSLEPNFLPLNADVTYGRSLTLKSRFIVGEVGAGGKNGGASKQHFSGVGQVVRNLILSVAQR